MMKLFLLAFFLALSFAPASSIPFSEKDLASEESLWDLYERWHSHHNLSRNLEEKVKRFNVFKENVGYIHKSNSKDKPYKLQLNKFGDMTKEEMKHSYAGLRIDNNSMQGKSLRSTGSFTHANARSTGSFMHANVSDLPLSIDWREKGAVTAVKDQGKCGSCWAFSTVVGVEGINQIKTGQLVSFSEQELVDCDNKRNHGCAGGMMDLAFEFVKKNGGLTTEANYPYVAEGRTCNASKENSHGVSIDGYEDVPANDEEALLKAVANQPISVAIEASGSDFQFYSEGVLTGNCGTELDHGVAIVGYGTMQDGTKYWIVRNSWGSSWGEKGYIKMQRGISAVEGLCGIAMQASYPVKTSPNLKPKKHTI